MLRFLSQFPVQNLALVDAQGVLSYGELCTRVEALAEELAIKHVEKGGAFALDMQDGIDWVIADLACMEAHIPVVPLPSFFTQAQREHAMHAAGCTVRIRGNLQCEDTNIPPVTLHHGTAKITFTSGTTGAPKGVCLSAEGMLVKVRELSVALRDIEIKRHRSLLSLSILLENIGGVYVSLLRGATVYLGMPDYTPAGIAKALRDSQANSCILVPELLKALVASGETLPDLRYVAVGGAHVPLSLLAQAREQHIPAYEGYGLSENGSVVALNVPSKDHIGSCGRLLRDGSISIASDGEIILHDPAFLGYVGESPREMTFATGDLGRINAEGYLHILGRKKNVIITSYGRNFSPEWVEKLLLSQPGIRQAAVFGDGKPFNIAVLNTSGPMVASNAIRAVNAELPDYAHIREHVLAREPFAANNQEMTPTGKINRSAIAAHYAQAIDALYNEVVA